MKILYIVLPLLLAGCQPARDFGRGFGEELTKQALEAGVDALGKKIDGLPRPAPGPTPGDLGTWGGLGALAAYVVGSLGKGFIREKTGKHKDV